MAKKKKKQQHASTTPAPAASSDFKTHEHSLFFDRLVELIPARFYLPSPDDEEKPWFHGLSKAARASAKKQTRENLKRARRDRLDPDKNTATTLDLLKRSIEGASQPPPSTPTDLFPKIPDDRSVTYEELRQRLRRKIDEIRGNRNSRAPEVPKPWKDDRSKKGGAFLGKHKREEGKGSEDGEGVVEKEAKKPKKDASGVDLSFGHVKLGGEKEGKRKRKGLSKKKELEKAERLWESMRDPEKGEELRERHSWKAAASRAAGGKVHDDPKLIMESMKKEEKRREKSAKKWGERVEVTWKLKEERQRKRVENISEKIKKKKAKRIEKREKKLMRPGFEGRKEGYVNES